MHFELKLIPVKYNDDQMPVSSDVCGEAGQSRSLSETETRKVKLTPGQPLGPGARTLPRPEAWTLNIRRHGDSSESQSRK